MRKKLVLAIIILLAFNSFSQNEIKIGNEIPAFKLWFTDGTTITKNDIQNKVVVFKFWFTSCLPCLLDIDQLNTLVSDFKNRDDILFLAPALDNKETIKNFVNKNRFDFKIAYSSIETSQKFNPIQVYPSYFIVDKNGKFTYVDSGTKQSHFENLKNALITTLKK